MRKTLSAAFATAALALGGSLAGAAPASAATAAPDVASAAQNSTAVRNICYSAHVQNQGWQGTKCNGAVAGTTGQALNLEALTIASSGTGGLCARAHVRNVGWQSWACAEDGTAVVIGTTGRNLPIEALELQVGTGTIAAQAHLRDVGWQRAVAAQYIQVGTVGQARAMEAIAIDV
ncbi:hypothetical protein [Streptomyces sp. NBC_01481]|uniref:hypothetical protein n=1 Tax=Streptomyces sp. NBC_01481 TaxID=2975869 RepID=UPI00224EF893|nr:hypothetical protein [Streptomyces sp. NBC_01481]MCX4586280.1 hypothetical protein [Streptomyces sp. NBC_01481]